MKDHTLTQVMLDIAPLVAIVEGRQMVDPRREGRDDLSGLWRSYLRSRKRGTISVVLADRICNQLLHLPAELVWGKAFFDEH